jgi:hypothetical protein
MKFFEIIDSFEKPDRWYLGAPRTFDGKEVDPRAFTSGLEYSGEHFLKIPVKQGSQPLDFTLGSFDMPVVKAEIAEGIHRLATGEIQRIPVKVEEGYDDYEAVNALTVLAALNEELSEITWWTKEDGLPSKVGTYAGIGKMVLNEREIKATQIFRLKNWRLPLLISEPIKDYLESIQATGIAFEEIKTV